jgi:hypothetical protein
MPANSNAAHQNIESANPPRATPLQMSAIMAPSQTLAGTTNAESGDRISSVAPMLLGASVIRIATQETWKRKMIAAPPEAPRLYQG